MKHCRIFERCLTLWVLLGIGLLSLLVLTGSFALAQSTADSEHATSTTPQLQAKTHCAELPSCMSKAAAAASPEPYIVLAPVINPNKPKGEHSPFVWPQEVRIETGVEITPNRIALQQGRPQPQQSRIAPVFGLQAIKWLKYNNGVAFQSDWSNTDTRLANFSQNTWTMNRVSFDGEYVRRFALRSWQPFVKAGVGGTIFISGHDRCSIPDCVAPDVGLDSRFEEIIGAGIAKGRFVVGYDAHYLRNPDFTDHTWFPQRNVLSGVFIGISDLRGNNAHGRRE